MQKKQTLKHKIILKQRAVFAGVSGTERPFGRLRLWRVLSQVMYREMRRIPVTEDMMDAIET